MRIEIVTKRGWFRTRYWWRIKAENGKILAVSEIYSSHQKAKETVVEAMRAARVGLPVVEVAE